MCNHCNCGLIRFLPCDKACSKRIVLMLGILSAWRNRGKCQGILPTSGNVRGSFSGNVLICWPIWYTSAKMYIIVSLFVVVGGCCLFFGDTGYDSKCFFMVIFPPWWISKTTYWKTGRVFNSIIIKPIDSNLPIEMFDWICSGIFWVP